MTPKEEFVYLTKAIEKTEIFKQLSSVKNAKELKQIWENFCFKNKKIISEVQEWETNHLDSDFDGYDIFIADENIENPIEVAICIRLMKEGGREIDIFQFEPNLSDALIKTDNNIAKRIAILSYNNFIHDIKAEDIIE